MNSRIALALFSLAILCLTISAAVTPVHSAVQTDTDRVNAILRALDDRMLTARERLGFFHDDAVIMAPDEAPIRGEHNLLSHLEAAAQATGVSHVHYYRSIERFDDIVVTEGGVRGEWRKTPASDPVAFETNNLIVFREDQKGVLKIWKVIFNHAPSSTVE
ncbi:MAG: hypothetical protein AAFN07_14255 [Pseudomonadota bacterium]